MARTKKVMVVFPVNDPQQMPLLRGITDFARQQKNWVLQVNPEMSSTWIRHLKSWPGQGMIAALYTRAEIAAARALGLPVVNLAGALRHTGLPRVMVDQEALGRLAAEHLLACGLRRFAYYGEGDMWYSQQRKQGFVGRLAEAGCSCSVFESTTHFTASNPWHRWMEPLQRWLKTLRGPVGVMAVHDYAAAIVTDACLRLGLRVPDDAAVIGVGNDPVTCEFAAVPLSSIARSNRQVGYEAAAMLHRLMAGAKPAAEERLIAPEGVVERRSTDLVAVDDPQVAAAMTFIRQHAGTPFGVKALRKCVSVAPRTLELRFRKCLRCTPHEYLCRTRVDRAKRLLADRPELKLREVAVQCGFSGPRHFRSVFRQLTGLTPGDYRRTQLTPRSG
jgi:LacI family transcriptional regulator